jgi:hypothetical protein
MILCHWWLLCTYKHIFKLLELVLMCLQMILHPSVNKVLWDILSKCYGTYSQHEPSLQYLFYPYSLRGKKPFLFNLHNHLEIDPDGKYNPTFLTDQKVMHKSTQTKSGLFKSIEYGTLHCLPLVTTQHLDETIWTSMSGWQCHSATLR